MSTRYHTLLELSPIIGDNIFDPLSLQFDSSVKVRADDLISKEISDSPLNKRMTATNFNHIIHKVTLSLKVLSYPMIRLSFWDIREDEDFLEHPLFFEELCAVFSSLWCINNKEFEALA